MKNVKGRLWGRAVMNVLPLLALSLGSVGVGGTAMATSRMGEATPVMDQARCVITVDHGFSETDIRLDACAESDLLGHANVSDVDVVYEDTFDGIVLPNPHATLTDQAQQAVRNAIEKHRSGFRWHYASCSDRNAKLTMQDRVVNLWGETGNPSQFVIDNILFVQFQSGCSA